MTAPFDIGEFLNVLDSGGPVTDWESAFEAWWDEQQERAEAVLRKHFPKLADAKETRARGQDVRKRKEAHIWLAAARWMRERAAEECRALGQQNRDQAKEEPDTQGGFFIAAHALLEGERAIRALPLEDEH